MKKIIFVLFLSLALSGCGFVVKNINDEDSRNLKTGMSKQEVVDVLGAPQKESIMTIEGKEYLVYQYPLEETKEAKIRVLPTNYFRVFFLDGKLVQWEKDKIIAQPAYRYPDTVIPGRGGKTVQNVSEPDKYSK